MCRKTEKLDWTCAERRTTPQAVMKGSILGGKTQKADQEGYY